MKKTYALIVGLMVLAVMAFPLTAAAAGKGISPSHDALGKITALSATTMTVQPATGAPVTVKFNSATKFFVDNTPGSRANLKKGDTVDIEYNSPSMVATRVEKQVN